MKAVYSLAGALALSLSAPVFADHHLPSNIEAAVANEARTPANAERDAERKAGETLAHYGVEEGMVVLDIFAGGGYFTEVFAGAVGDDGHVHAHQSSRRLETARSEFEAQYARFGNITIAEFQDGRLDLEDNSVDMAFFGLVIHHFHFDEDNPDARPQRAAELYAEVMRVLRPGGTFAITEHVAIDGSSRADSAAWHRIPLQTAIDDVTASGFVFAGNNDTLHVNAEDDNANFWGDTGLRGRTNRMVLSFTKPE